jgi:hypothetical protein
VIVCEKREIKNHEPKIKTEMAPSAIRAFYLYFSVRETPHVKGIGRLAPARASPAEKPWGSIRRGGLPARFGAYWEAQDPVNSPVVLVYTELFGAFLISRQTRIEKTLAIGAINGNVRLIE